jgi:hypothetical protein
MSDLEMQWQASNGNEQPHASANAIKAFKRLLSLAPSEQNMMV